MTLEQKVIVTGPDGKELFAEQARDRVKFPLLVRFELRRPNEETLHMTAGFRDWPHYLAYAAQMKERNNYEVRKPVEIKEPTH